MTPEELAAARALIAAMVTDRPRGARTGCARTGAGASSTCARLARDAIATGGDPVRRRFRRRTQAPRKLVVLCDVSGSMEPYTRALLLYLHAMVRSGRGVEVFAFGTRLTRLTAELRTRDPEQALARAADRVVDWASGTRIGASLKRYNDVWGRRALTRGAVVLIASDGWERQDHELVGREMARLHRAAYAVVWVNPVKGSPDVPAAGRRDARGAALDRPLRGRPQPREPRGARRPAGADRAPTRRAESPFHRRTGTVRFAPGRRQSIMREGSPWQSRSTRTPSSSWSTRSAELERLGTGFTFTEGPIWNPDGLPALQRHARRRAPALGPGLGGQRGRQPVQQGQRDDDRQRRPADRLRARHELGRAHGPRRHGRRARGARHPLRGPGAQQPQRRRRQERRRDLLHRPDLRAHARLRHRARAGPRLPGRLPHRARGRRPAAARRRLRPAQRAVLLDRRVAALHQRHRRGRTSASSTSPTTARSRTRACWPTASARAASRSATSSTG